MRADRADEPQKPHRCAIGIAARPFFEGGRDAVDAREMQGFFLVQRRVRGEGMPRQVQPRNLLLHSQQFAVRQFGHGGKRLLSSVQLGRIKEAHLPRKVAAVKLLVLIDEAIGGLDHLVAVGSKAVQRAAAVRLSRPRRLKSRQGDHPLDKGGEADKRAVFLPFADKLLNKASAQVLDGEKAEADVIPYDGEAGSALIDRGREHPDLQPLALPDIARYLAGCPARWSAGRPCIPSGRST